MSVGHSKEAYKSIRQKKQKKLKKPAKRQGFSWGSEGVMLYDVVVGDPKKLYQSTVCTWIATEGSVTQCWNWGDPVQIQDR